MYSAIVRNAEALGGMNVSPDAVKKMSFQTLYNSCWSVRVDDIFRQWVSNRQCSDRSVTAGKTVWVRGTASLGTWLDRIVREGTWGM